MLITPGYYPDSRNDHVFRRIFGDPKHSHVLRRLLNSVLDVDCWDRGDHEFIVEMQITPQSFSFDQYFLFTKTENKLATMAEKWTHFFKYAGAILIGRIPAALRVPKIEKAFKVLLNRP